MIAAGLVPEETKHNGHRRALFHDYSRPGVYMITLVTEGRQRVFGCIEGHTRGMRGTDAIIKAVYLFYVQTYRFPMSCEKTVVISLALSFPLWPTP